MLESFRMQYGIWLAVRRFRKKDEPVISFTDAVSGAKQALVVMPLDRSELLSAMNVIEMLKRMFNEQSITVIGDERGVETIRLMPKSHFVQIKETDITPLFHPRQTFLSLFSDRKFDLAIDLNLDLVLPSAYICRASNAKVRVGFKGPSSDMFYNFQIQHDPSRSRRDLYDRFAQCLHMF